MFQTFSDENLNNHKLGHPASCCLPPRGMSGITTLHKERFIFPCLDLEELFLFTQEVTGQEISAVGFRLKSLKSSEKRNRSA